MEEREDSYSGNAIEWRWVIVGSLIGAVLLCGLLGGFLGEKVQPALEG